VQDVHEAAARDSSPHYAVAETSEGDRASVSNVAAEAAVAYADLQGIVAMTAAVANSVYPSTVHRCYTGQPHKQQQSMQQPHCCITIMQLRRTCALALASTAPPSFEALLCCIVQLSSARVELSYTAIPAPSSLALLRLSELNLRQETDQQQMQLATAPLV
jgi:hypothetical protein